MTDFIVDAHLDLAHNAVALRRDLRLPLETLRARERVTPPPGNFPHTSMVTLPELQRGKVAVIGGSIFAEPVHSVWAGSGTGYRDAEGAHSQARTQLDMYFRWADEGALRLLHNNADLEATLTAWRSGPSAPGVFLVLEGADPIRKPDELGWWVEQGLRGVGLSWAVGTVYAGGNANPGPLTDEGRALLREMASFNLLLDISHLWEAAAYTALDSYPGPIAATHANPRALVDGPRQLPDALIRRLAERDGVVGVVPFNRMLLAGWTESDPRLPLRRLAEAIDHICQLTGSARHVGLGTDFDGGMGREAAPLDLDSIADLGKLEAVLRERGYMSDDVAAVLRENWLRIMRATLSAF